MEGKGSGGNSLAESSALGVAGLSARAEALSISPDEVAKKNDSARSCSLAGSAARLAR